MLSGRLTPSTGRTKNLIASNHSTADELSVNTLLISTLRIPVRHTSYSRGITILIDDVKREEGPL